MNNRILIFDTKVSGHHIEYVHHLLQKANLSKDEYVFYLPKQFEKAKGNDLNWSYRDNISFHFFDVDDRLEKVPLLLSSYRKCLLLKRAIREQNVTHVFLITLMEYIPFLSFIISRSNIRISGIIYQIYLYRWKSSSLLQKLMDVCKYLILTYSKCIDTIYVLNDRASVRRFNYLYHTNKYKFLVDPYVPLKVVNMDLSTLGIKEGNTVFFHFGSLAERKGTLDLLKAIKLINSERLSKSTFILAGRVSESIKDNFYTLLNDISFLNICQIIVFDEFCDYELIAELCKRSDMLLMPYKVISQSSGLIGYAAQYNTPVLAPANGLIGKLVKKYKLGYLLKSVTPIEIATFINEMDLNKRDVSKEYLKENTIDNFITGIVF